MIPWRSEWVIFDSESKIAGAIDMVYKKKDGTFAIFDWKRTKRILFSFFKTSKTKYVFESVDLRVLVLEPPTFGHNAEKGCEQLHEPKPRRG